jgi:meso-butanediol dehydrogenase/(S,S)-butanediol dehydrogenase/diacetyl reductase
MSKFEGKVAIVTGSASGMGKATALKLASEGAKVILGDVNDEGNQATAAEIDAAGGVAKAINFNATDEASCKALVSSAVETFGQLDVLVNAAGIANFYSLDELSTDIFDRFMDINLKSVFIICREAMPHLKETKGNIVNFASLNAKVMTAYQTAYCASKAAVAAVTKCLAQEFAADGVRANVVCPGGIKTAMVKNMRYPENMDRKLLAKLAPLGAMGQPEQVASLVSFLASDEASYINGEDIFIDGGTRSTL